MGKVPTSCRTSSLEGREGGNRMATHRWQTVLAVGSALWLVAPLPALAQAVRRDAGLAGFATNVLPANDDQYTLASVPSGFTINCVGTNWSQLFVNNNG